MLRLSDFVVGRKDFIIRVAGFVSQLQKLKAEDEIWNAYSSNTSKQNLLICLRDLTPSALNLHNDFMLQLNIFIDTKLSCQILRQYKKKM